MNPIVIIVIVLVVAMIVGPVTMMQPSQSQRRREKLRRYAREAGLSVRLLPPPQLATDTQAPAALPVYSKVVDAHHLSWTLMRARYAHESHLRQWWQFVGAKPPEPVQRQIENALDMLPSGVVGLRAGGRQLDIFWQEQGDEHDLEQLLKCMACLTA
ncbi:hypothetical protein [Gilvimarinus polysaccharolyticus]|uniref:hypothetical protein n=1 Tax=Gilvimarinus polysaccharolyticus TaxID=863921 RepID=UPI000673AEC9|nr:hypothetical protein [Gilvimarinus polysaccharolyticus]